MKSKKRKHGRGRSENMPELTTKDGTPIKFGQSFLCLQDCNYYGQGNYKGDVCKVVSTSRANQEVYMEGRVHDMDYCISQFDEYWERLI